MEFVLDLNNSQNWKLAFNQEQVAKKTATGLFLAIPAFEVAPLNQHILAVLCTSKSAKSHWRYAGNLYQRINLGLGLPIADATTIKIPLNRVTLIKLPHYSSEYELNFVAAYWLTSLKLTIWKYTGEDKIAIESMLEKMQVDISRIEARVEDISNYTY